MDTVDTQLMDNAATVSKQGTISFGGNSLELFLRYLYSVVLARALGAANMGLYFLGFSVLNFIFLAARLELQDGVLRFVSLYRGAGDKARARGAALSAIKLVVASSLLVCAVFMIFSNSIAGIFKQPLLGNVIKIFIISLPFMGLTSIVISYFQANLKMKFQLVTQNLFQPLVNILIFIAVFLAGGRLFGAIFSYVLTTVLTFLLAIYLANKKLGLLDNRIKPVTQTKELLMFSLPLVIAALLHFAIQWMDAFILGASRSADEVGVYGMTLRTASLCTIFLVPLNTAFTPLISDLYNRRMAGSLCDTFKLVSKWIVTLTLPVMLLIILFAKEILMLFGPEFIAGSGPLIILCLGQVFQVAASAVYYVILMSGRSRVVLINSIIICAVSLALSLVLIPKYGIWGAAIANAVTLAIFNVLMLFEGHFFLHIHPYSLKFLKPVTAAVLSAGVCCTVRAPLGRFAWPFSAACPALILVSCYALILFLLGFDKEDAAAFDLFRRRVGG